LPQHWNHLPAFPDAAEGLERLRSRYLVCTLSNMPVGQQIKLLKNNRLNIDGHLDISQHQTFKPYRDAYYTPVRVLGIDYTNIMMVTGNRSFGDLENAKNIGMLP